MAFTTPDIAALVFKKLIAGKAASSTQDKAYYEEAFGSRAAILSTQLWTESARIPQYGMKQWVSGTTYENGDHILWPGTYEVYEAYGLLEGGEACSTEPPSDSIKWRVSTVLKYHYRKPLDLIAGTSDKGFIVDNSGGDRFTKTDGGGDADIVPSSFGLIHPNAGSDPQYTNLVEPYLPTLETSTFGPLPFSLDWHLAPERGVLV